MKKYQNNVNVFTCDKFKCLEINTFCESKKTPKTNVFVLIVVGLVIGFVNGFWGGGGGMICVPTLISILKLPEKVGHATTLLIMLPLSIASFVVYLIGGSIDWSLAWKVGIGFVLGGVLGAMLLKKINNNVLKLVFAGVIIYGGFRLVI